MADTEINEQTYEGFELTDYSDPDKVKALIKHLALDSATTTIVEERDTYEINPRKVKRGDSPEKYIEVITAFKKLLTPKQRDKINSYLKLLGTFEKNCKVKDTLYKELDKALQKKKKENNKETKEAVRICEAEMMYLGNIVSALLDDDDYARDSTKAYREAWFGRKVVDRREYEEVNDGRYYVLTDEEADKKARDYIEDSLWAFNTDFIISHSKVLDYDSGSEAIVAAVQEKCEGGNEAIRRLIDDIDEFVQDAINADGRGHFINMDDGTEEEVDVDGVTYYIYKE